MHSTLLNFGVTTRKMDRQQLIQAVTLRQAGMSGSAISDILNVRRHVMRYALGRLRDVTEITDMELDTIVRAMMQQNPYGGHRLVRARLLARGVHVSRLRVLQSMRRVASETMELRRHRALRRRRYSVPHFNYIWHVDGHHKLILWIIVIHGGIDGYSRVCAFLVAAPNNTSLTALSAFLSGVATFGAPRFVRVDAGGENKLIRRYINHVRGPRASIVGRSVHNQRIERLWRDVFRSVACVYYDVLRRLEISGALDVANPEHIRRVHEYLLPIVNAALLEFRQAWNVHGLRTEHYRTPSQLAACSRARDYHLEGCSDVEQHRLAAQWLLEAEQLRDSVPALLQNANLLDYSRDDLFAALQQRLQC